MATKPVILTKVKVLWPRRPLGNHVVRIGKDMPSGYGSTVPRIQDTFIYSPSFYYFGSVTCQGGPEKLQPCIIIS